MIPHIRSLIAVFCVTALAAGCGGSDSPTEPEPDPTPEPRFTLVLDFSSVQVIEDCDGIEGDGDFVFQILVGNEQVSRETINLGPGGRTRAIGRRSYVFAGLPAGAAVTFFAAELDKSITGAEYVDTRLKPASAAVQHSYGDSGWSNPGPNSITLGGEGCQVRLSWIASGGSAT